MAHNVSPVVSVRAAFDLALATINRPGLRHAFVLLAGVLLFADMALSFPEMVRHGYTQCSSCHVSPQGGGALTPYGRMISGEVLSTFSAGEREQAALYLTELPQSVSVGGDVRYISIRNPYVKKQFLMQADAELALAITPKLTAVATYGAYGYEAEERLRQAYLLLRRPGDNASLRVGRFLAAYSILGPDHTTYARKALGNVPGGETINAEVILADRDGELALTGVLGADGALADQEQGFTLKGSLFAGTSYVVGTSYLYLARQDSHRSAAGVFANLGFTKWLYASAQADRIFQAEIPEDIWGASIGIEPWLGLHLVYLSEHSRNSRTRYKNGLEVKLYPRPHFELLARASREHDVEIDVDTYLFLIHYYL